MNSVNNVIYIDLLVMINLYITFFLIEATGAFLHRKLKTRRLVLGSLAGGLSSLIVLLPPLPLAVNAAIRIAAGVAIVLIAFGYRRKEGYVLLKNLLFFTIINIVFAGVTLMLWLFAAPLGMEWSGGFVYFDISLPLLIVTTAAAYGLIRLLRFFLDVRGAADKQYRIEIELGGKTAVLPAIADTGNALTDFFSGLSVVVVPHNSLDIDLDDPALFPRLLPYNTIDSRGLIPVFRPKRLVLTADGGTAKTITALVGVSENFDCNAPAVFNPRLLL
ncbi:MAG: sigma-E processing peptidase SpoIIGA [Oscillospiraceae bacterium]|nr:sigma-E processing peptidase SpoIIGA [Oscillospiraceae bacterium]